MRATVVDSLVVVLEALALTRKRRRDDPVHRINQVSRRGSWLSTDRVTIKR